ncbi:Protein saf4 [Umbelopsis nana]
MENDAFFKLEHGVHDENKAKESVPVLTQLQRLNDAQWSDPYTQSQQLRRKFRDQKRIDKANLEKKEQLRDKMSLHIDLVDEHPDDHVKAKLTEFADPVITGAEKRKAQVQVGPLFSKRTLSASSGSAKEDLATRLVTQTRKKVDPFLQGSTSFPRPSTNVTGNINGLANVVLKTSSTAANDKRSAAGSGSSLKSLVSSHYVDSDDSDA